MSDELTSVLLRIRQSKLDRVKKVAEDIKKISGENNTPGDVIRGMIDYGLEKWEETQK